MLRVICTHCHTEFERETLNDSMFCSVPCARAHRALLEPEMIRIPAGTFLMGDDEISNASPQHEVTLEEYEIAKYAVTCKQYKLFLEANPTYKVPEGWSGTQYPKGKANHPVVNVSWYDATAYAEWLSRVTGKDYRLPTEAEWEKAARGTDGRKFPWGDEFDTKKCNTAESGIGDTTPVDTYPDGASPYGVMDMAGNVWEWCADWYAPYPNDKDKKPAGKKATSPRKKTTKSKVAVMANERQTSL